MAIKKFKDFSAYDIVFYLRRGSFRPRKNVIYVILQGFFGDADWLGLAVQEHFTLMMLFGHGFRSLLGVVMRGMLASW